MSVCGPASNARAGAAASARAATTAAAMRRVRSRRGMTSRMAWIISISFVHGRRGSCAAGCASGVAAPLPGPWRNLSTGAPDSLEYAAGSCRGTSAWRDSWLLLSLARATVRPHRRRRNSGNRQSISSGRGINSESRTSAPGDHRRAAFTHPDNDLLRVRSLKAERGCGRRARGMTLSAAPGTDASVPGDTEALRNKRPAPAQRHDPTPALAAVSRRVARRYGGSSRWSEASASCIRA